MPSDLYYYSNATFLSSFLYILLISFTEISKFKLFSNTCVSGHSKVSVLKFTGLHCSQLRNDGRRNIHIF